MGSCCEGEGASHGGGLSVETLTPCLQEEAPKSSQALWVWQRCPVSSSPRRFRKWMRRASPASAWCSETLLPREGRENQILRWGNPALHYHRSRLSHPCSRTAGPIPPWHCRAAGCEPPTPTLCTQRRWRQCWGHSCPHQEPSSSSQMLRGSGWRSTATTTGSPSSCSRLNRGSSGDKAGGSVSPCPAPCGPSARTELVGSLGTRRDVVSAHTEVLQLLQGCCRDLAAFAGGLHPVQGDWRCSRALVGVLQPT